MADAPQNVVRTTSSTSKYTQDLPENTLQTDPELPLPPSRPRSPGVPFLPRGKVTEKAKRAQGDAERAQESLLLSIRQHESRTLAAEARIEEANSAMLPLRQQAEHARASVSTFEVRSSCAQGHALTSCGGETKTVTGQAGAVPRLPRAGGAVGTRGLTLRPRALPLCP